MKNVFRRIGLCGAFLPLALIPAVAAAQAKTETALDRQLARIDLAITGAGEFTKNTSGTNLQGQAESLRPSTTIGPLVQIRYTRSPLVGFEYNYGFSRYTQDVTYNAVGTTGLVPTRLGIQNKATEYTVGYVVHTKQYFGLQPFAAVGAGSIAFRPTSGGGLSFHPQARAAYYYNVGVEQTVLSPHFGLRVQFRQLFYLAPDFETNYLTTKQRTFTTEPAAGFFLRF